MKVYRDNIDKLKSETAALAKSDKKISATRLLTMLAAIFLTYKGYKTGDAVFYISGFIGFSAFLLLIKKHDSIRWLNLLAKTKINVNQDEIEFLEKGLLPFEDGKDFIQHDHPYSYDLDFFGEKSIFQTLNRTSTFKGKQKLAESLLQILPPNEILETQEAVKELSNNLGWRQELLALGLMNSDSQDSYESLMEWSRKPTSSLNVVLRVLSFILPLATLISLSVGFFIPNGVFGNITFLLFLVNLAIVGAHTKSIRSELLPATKIEAILRQYSFLLKEIENQSFKSEYLKSLQSELTGQGNASRAILQLSLLFGRMEHVTNVFASPLLNGFLQYHLHVLKGFFDWRKKHGSHIEKWLDTIGAFEQLSSLANFSYNNPMFEFPSINSDYKIKFEELGHPLLPRSKSVTNSIDFDNHQFFILTGSNMSGKSTFLRTVGINMVLGGIGAPVYAQKANIHPLPVLVSMRLSDSLTDSESYFYAEVKRLKSIMDRLDKEACFILLDEILRGTNSDDKREGTIEVIRKMATKKAYGGIATHDLEVCKVVEEYPDAVVNKRFEVAIVNDELVFDYKLLEGVCQNKSASFIMKKMGVV